jgi:hypothetical protein
MAALIKKLVVHSNVGKHLGRFHWACGSECDNVINVWMDGFVSQIVNLFPDTRCATTTGTVNSTKQGSECTRLTGITVGNLPTPVTNICRNFLYGSSRFGISLPGLTSEISMLRRSDQPNAAGPVLLGVWAVSETTAQNSLSSTEVAPLPH